MSLPESDFVQRFLFEDLDIRGSIVSLREAWVRMHSGRHYAAPVRTMLGEICAVTTLIGTNLKQPGRLSFQLQGDGPVSMLMIECTEQLRLRGMAKAAEVPEASDIPTLLGHGRLVLTLQPEDARQPYQSLVPLDGTTITEVFAHYLEQSVQQPAHLALFTEENFAVGLLLQKLPNADQRDADGWDRITQLAATLSPHELAALEPARLLARVFPEETVRLFDPRPVRYHCPQDWDKVRKMLRALGRSELEALLREQGTVIVHDDVCNYEYRFDADEVEALFGSEEPPPTLH